ncbi:MAG: divalent-cation tolerance protein CutA [Leptolyngbyaceae cyanobacterium bins.349]|nr:divalent-cation tolerance protein CutA [Leptolyngbyaceae cyanobacterium bins.349]
MEQFAENQFAENQFAENSFSVVLVTVPSQAHATAIARTLVEANLAACVNFFPIHSVYTWQGSVQQEEEWQLLIKSRLAKFSALAAKIRSIHPYEVPEIIALPIQAGSPPYLQWIADHVGD